MSSRGAFQCTTCRISLKQTSRHQKLQNGWLLRIVNIAHVEVERVSFAAGLLPMKLTEPTYFNRGHFK